MSGQLTVYLGMCAGVGKTYAMLRKAHELKNAGADVVVGFVETHGRVHTEALLEGLAILPTKVYRHQDRDFAELDLDAILERRPHTVVVDELPHSNVPGSRHDKRYRDVQELVGAGINVLTAMNIQHLESLAESVLAITGQRIRETVPDSVLDAPTEVILVDIGVDELLKRLDEGKIYGANKIAKAKEHFFQPSSLMALRELALRKTANTVDSKLASEATLNNAAGDFRAKEKLLVALGPSPYSAQVLRWAKHLASQQKADLVAVSIRTMRPFTAEEEQRISRVTDLARELGAEVVWSTSDDIPTAILRTAVEHRVTQIVVGKSRGVRSFAGFRRESLVDVLMRLSGTVDIHAVQVGQDSAPVVPTTTAGAPQQHTVREYVLATCGVVVAAFIASVASYAFGYQAIGLMLLLAVVVAGLYLRRGPLLYMAGATAVLWNFLFIEPRFTLWISNPADAVLIALYFATALVAGSLTNTIRSQITTVIRKEESATALYRLARDLATATSYAAVEHAIQSFLRHSGAAESRLLIANSNDNSELTFDGAILEDQLAAKEYAVALWAFRNRTPAGRHTQTLSAAYFHCRPLVSASATTGILAVHFQEPVLSAETETLLETATRLVSVVVDRLRAVEENKAAQLREESKNLERALFDSISHELRTPIAVITAASSQMELPEQGVCGHHHLVQAIREAALRLNALVDNLLNMSRLRAGRVEPVYTWCDIDEAIDAARALVAAERNVEVEADDAMPFVYTDEGLVIQSVAILLHNAVAHTQNDVRIVITRTITQQGMLCVSVCDEGPGIPDEQIETITKPFVRGHAAAAGGTGLGLAIVAGFAKSMGGHLEIRNRPSGGLQASILVPSQVSESPIPEGWTAE